MRYSAPASVFAFLLAAVSTGCNSDASSVGSYSIAKAGGDSQTAVAGGALPARPSIQIIDGNGVPVANFVVVFAVSGGGGTVLSAIDTTNNLGYAVSGTWTLGVTAGVNTLTATAAGVPGSPLTFTATGVAVANLVKVSGEGQSGRAGTTLINPVVMQVTDASGNPVSGVPVSFSITGGAGTLAGGGSLRQVATDGAGFATTTWNLGTTPGTNTMLVFVPGNNVIGNNATFTATGN